ncbi:MAG: thioredoxin domain-containing protein [Actinomycetota bacterium]|nr:MAG: thioredoxin domain-containing protein [Actinomycetota bacterium]
MANRLASATSPYLLQHAENPVDWWEWGPEAFAEAKRRDVPILLSVGYAACHWCHVMAHESFEDAATAGLMNARFVSVKVDREERPDVDAVYMRATQALTGHGGWPMTVFVDHDGSPFYAGTYWPREPRAGSPAFTQVLLAVDDAWRDRRDAVRGSAADIRDLLSRQQIPAVTGGPPDAALLDEAVAVLASQYDAQFAGFGGAPKFPPSMVLEFLLRHHGRVGDRRALAIVSATCEAMARGGMYDQLGGGFARYAVDRSWTVPHFEKMLYDNALLLRVYLHWWRATGHRLAERVSRETADFLLRELRTEQGGFASALDADAAGLEGSTYVWTQEQLAAALGTADAAWAARLLEVTTTGTFEGGSSVLQLPADPQDSVRWESVRQRLLAARAGRPQPARDDKVVAGWNGLAIAALAEAGALLGVPAYLDAATAAADLLVAVHLVESDRVRLARVSRDGTAGRHAGVLEDYAGVAEGLLALYQVTGRPRWLTVAGQLLDVVLSQFRDDTGAFYDTAWDAEELVARPQDPADNATPSGSSAAAGALLTFAALTGSVPHRDAAGAALGVVAAIGRSQPRFAGWGLAVAEAWADGPREVAVVGPDDPARAALHHTALMGTAPGLVVAVAPPAADPPGADQSAAALVVGRPLLADGATAYVCRDFSCQAPTADVGQLAAQVGALPEPGRPPGLPAST